MTNVILFSISIYLLYKFYNIIKFKLNFKKKVIFNILLIIIVLWVVSVIIIFPQNAVSSALNGLNTWFNIVFPSLLPFFIMSELLIGLGIVDFISVLLEPITTFLFKVPGEGSFVFAMSVTSGYPMGAKLVSELRLKNKISRIEGQRLVSLCSTSGPLFMIGAVSIGMFKNPSIGPLIALSHYLGALSVGLIFRFYGMKENKKYITKPNNIKYAFSKLINSRKSDSRRFILILRDSVKDSINNLLMIGGFIILYSVVIEVLSISNIFDYLTNIFIKVFPSINDTNLIKGLLSGLVEITIGISKISLIESSNYIIKIAIVSLLIGWSGISIHSQSLSFLSDTDIKGTLYIISKGIHGFLSSIYTILLFNFFINSDVPVFKAEYVPNNFIYSLNNWLSIVKYSIKLMTLTLVIITLLGLAINLINGITKK